MTPDHAHQAYTHDEMEEIATRVAKATVRETLLRLGVDEKDSESSFSETRKDLAYAHRLRRASEQISKASIWTIVGVIGGGLLAALWVGLQSVIHGGPPPTG